jgi:alpha-galactosidase
VTRIAFIGAGSLVFARRLIADMLSFAELKEATFALMDIDAKRLDYTRRVADRIVREGGSSAQVEVTTDRREALRGADYVITMFQVGALEVIRHDIEIPLKHGVDQCFGDTLGPGGVFRSLRTIPVMVDICRDMEEICPDAWLLNYTNPMAMNCWAVNKTSAVRNVGLCHSVQGTAQWLSALAGVPEEHRHEVSHWVAGINHQSWFLDLRWRGQDLYPVLRSKIDEQAVYNLDTTRFEMLKHLGYFPTESSGHNSEYLPWFRKRPEILKKYTPGGGWNGGTGFMLQLYGRDREDEEKELERMASGEEPLNLKRSEEYGSYIIHSLETGVPCRINGNVANTGLITNLPDGCCVEVPCYVDNHGINPCFVGDLPPHLAAINRSNIAVQELAVRAALDADRDMVFYAVALDPLTAAALSLEEIRQMVDEMFKAEAEWLPYFA